MDYTVEVISDEYYVGSKPKKGDWSKYTDLYSQIEYMIAPLQISFSSREECRLFIRSFSAKLKAGMFESKYEYYKTGNNNQHLFVRKVK